MNATEDVTTLGLTADAHTALRALKDGGYFGEMVDAYRFAIAYAIARGVTPPEASTGKRQTIFNVGTLDPDGTLRAAVRALAPEGATAPYRHAEKLAEWGVLELGAAADAGTLSIVDLVRTDPP